MLLQWETGCQVISCYTPHRHQFDPVTRDDAVKVENCCDELIKEMRTSRFVNNTSLTLSASCLTEAPCCWPVVTKVYHLSEALPMLYHVTWDCGRARTIAKSGLALLTQGF